MNTSPTRPVLRYHGGKWRIAPWIIGHFPRHRIYVEPYCGAASVLLRKRRAYAEVLNDLHGGIVDLFRLLRDRDASAELVRQIRLTPFAREELELSFEQADDRIEAARRLVFRSAAGFSDTVTASGLRTGFRNSATRPGTIPAHDWAVYPDMLAAVVGRLQGVIIENRPALDVVEQFDTPETLLYVDPPYVAGTRGETSLRAYDHDMDDADHAALAGLLHRARGMVVLSGYPSPLYDELFGDWARVERSAFADGAEERVECLWINDRAMAGNLPLFGGIE